MRSLNVKDAGDTGGGNAPPPTPPGRRESVPVEKDPVDVPATPAEEK